MKYFTVDSTLNVDLLKVYIQYLNEYSVGINLLHTHTKLSKTNTELLDFIDNEIFKSILDYMSFYSIKHNIGIEILKRNSIEFEDVIDLLFYKSDETFTVVYK